MKRHHHSIGVEAHHQSKRQHEGKGWKIYLFEFFMLFFAVFCGFQAEYLLEHKIERDRERQFISSMVNEIELDSRELNNVLADSMCWRNLFSLALYIASGDQSLGNNKRILSIYFKNKYAWFMTFNKNTLTQLKSAGNMRLIRNQSVVDSLNQLDNLITWSEKILDWQIDLQHEMWALAGKIFDSHYICADGQWISLDNLDSIKTSDFITRDRKLLSEFSQKIYGEADLLRTYHFQLKQYKKFSDRLTVYLKKEYHLK